MMINLNIGEDRDFPITIAKGLDLSAAVEIRAVIADSAGVVRITKTKANGGITATVAGLATMRLRTSDTAGLAPGVYTIEVWVESPATFDRLIVDGEKLTLKRGAYVPST